MTTLEMEVELTELTAFKLGKMDTLHLHLWKDLHVKLQAGSTDI